MDTAFDAFDREDWAEAERLYLKRIEAAETGKAKEDAMHMLAFTLAMMGDYEESRELYEELLSRAESRGDHANAAVAMHQIGMAYRLEGDGDRASRWIGREWTLRSDKLPDDHAGFSAAAYEFGEIGLLKNELEESLGSFQLALRRGKEAGDDICIACAWRGIGQVRSRYWHDPKPAYEQSLAAFRRAGDSRGEAEVLRLMGGQGD